MIGGMDRSESELISAAQRAGHELECHNGRVGGRGFCGLRATIERSDVVIIITGLTSHGSMYAAKKLARLLGREAIILRKCGIARLPLLLDELVCSQGAGPNRLENVA